MRDHILQKDTERITRTFRIHPRLVSVLFFDMAGSEADQRSLGPCDPKTRWRCANLEFASEDSTYCSNFGNVISFLPRVDTQNAPSTSTNVTRLKIAYSDGDSEETFQSNGNKVFGNSLVSLVVNNCKDCLG